MSSIVELMRKLEGFESLAYDDTEGNTTVGIGFNMVSSGARKIWDKLHIIEDFDEVLVGRQEISVYSATRLFNDFWDRCVQQAKTRTIELGLDWNSFNEYKQFVLADIAYNVGSVTGWTKVFKVSRDTEVMVESRRKQRELDSRVAKIAYSFGVIEDLAEAKKLGLTEAKYIT